MSWITDTGGRVSRLQFGYDEAWIGECHSAGTEITTLPETSSQPLRSALHRPSWVPGMQVKDARQ